MRRQVSAITRVDDGERAYPNPASRFQPEGPHGASKLMNPSTYTWNDAGWRGRPLEGQVIYELHVGTFTREGTWTAAAAELDELASLGITTIELMPIAEFDGDFGWGYDGVARSAPYHRYGRPDDLRAFVDEAHRVGLAVILDVVYNHLGPSGNYLRVFSPTSLGDVQERVGATPSTSTVQTLPRCASSSWPTPATWIDEFHMDGLRLDATQQIYDASSRHIIAEVGAAVREQARGRATFLVAENEPQLTELVRDEATGGLGARRPVERRLPSRGDGGPDGPPRGLLLRHGPAPRQVHHGPPSVRLLFQGQRCTWPAMARGRPASTWRRLVRGLLQVTIVALGAGRACTHGAALTRGT